MKIPLTLLVVEDSPDDCELLLAELQRANFEPRWTRVDSEADFLAQIQARPDLILSDYSLPGFSGLRALQLLRQNDPDIPFILVSGTVGEDVAVEAMKQGAMDYLLKDRIARLGAAVHQALEQKRLRDERKRTDRELHWRTAFFEAQVNSAPDGILVVDNQHKRILQNQRLLEFFQVPHDIAESADDTRMLQHALGRVKHPEEFLRRVEHLYAHPDEVGLEEIELLDGRILNRYSAPVRDQAGTYYGRIWSFRDITQRKLSEIAIKKLNRVYAVMSDINQTIVRNPDPQAMFTAACQIAVEKGGFRLAWIGLVDVESKAITVAAHAGNGDDYVNQLKLVISDDATRDGPTATAIKTGGHMVCNDIEHDPLMAPWREPALRAGYRASAAFPLVVRGQAIGSFNLYSEELGFFDEAEVRLLGELAADIAFAVELNRREAERQKLEEQFRQSQKMEAFGQLASGVAHDFNNILGVIQMLTGLLRSEENISPQQLEYASEIERNAERAANLTRQLLLFSRKQTMQLRDLNLNDIVANITKLLQRVLGEQVRMRLIFAAQPLLVHADPGMMDQVLMNLTVNSRDAMPNGGQLIIETSKVDFDEVSAAQSPQARPGHFACLSVSDTGEGIPKEILPRIFEPFFTTKDIGKGTGLGLATLFGILQQHQGWVNVYSEVGRGTTFRIYLPRLAQSAHHDTSPPKLNAMRGGTETILVVEDDAALRKVVRNALTFLGYRVLEAASGNEALRLWQRHQVEIRLLLTDLVMPDGLNGKELAAKLLEENRGLKVVYTSGYSADLAKDLRLEEGVNFLAKPFESHKLAQTVRARLDAKI